jgi:UDP-N-acetylglucosamine 4,6-dehydratase
VHEHEDTFKQKTILVTGGTGSFGRAFISKLLKTNDLRKIIVFSRDELKQHEMRQLADFQSDRIRWFLGDIRDKDRLRMAFAEVDYVIHAAALKQVDTGEYNPIEFIKTNVLGSQNVVEACIETGVKRVIALSTDKASSPINLYGATKLTADKLFVSANIYGSRTGTTFAVVRYGNVIGSRGSVIPKFRHDIKTGKDFHITDTRMTRFWITLNKATDFVIDNLKFMRGGEIFVPKIPSMNIVDLAIAMDPSRDRRISGIRPGEKLHEEMVSEYEAYRTIEWNDRYVILPEPQHALSYPGFQRVGDSFSYRSDNNPRKLTVAEMRDILSEI